MRLGLVWLYVVVVGIYAWRDWYVGLCGLILLVAIIQHPDMPKSVAGIQGLNPWNVLGMSVFGSWLRSRTREHLTWDMPKYINWLLWAYLSAIAMGTARSLADPPALSDSFASMFSEQVINTIKWPVVGLLLFDGCRNRSRFTYGLTAILMVYFLIGLQVIRWMPANAIVSGKDLELMSRKLLSNEVGFHPINLSMMLGGAFWAMWVVGHGRIGFLTPRLLTLASFITFYAQALTAGRMGYATWAILGLFLSIVRWRKYLLAAPVLVPVLIFALMTFAPGAMERLTKGFSKESVDSARVIGQRGGKVVTSNQGPDMYTVTSGRSSIWPFVIEKIREAPLFGYGRQAMIRTGLEAFLWTKYLESFPHPHNAYLEFLLDNGVVGFVLVIPFYLVILIHGVSLFRDSRSPIFMVSGGVATALVLALLVAAFGSQTFYPREGSVGMWCAIGLMLRVFVERKRILVGQRQSVTPAVRVLANAAADATEAVPGRRPGALLRPQSVRKQQTSIQSLDDMLWPQAA